jgi:hypothetical protein
MSLNRRWRRTAALLLVFSWPLFFSNSVRAQGYSQDQIKAATLINIVGFIQWPPGAILPAPSPVTFCLLGRGGVSDELERSAPRQEFAGHKIAVRQMKGHQDLNGCHLVFVSAAAEKLQQRLIESARGLPVVLVAEIAGFADKGGTINMGFQNGRITFVINAESTEEARLKINPKLLAAAHIVRSENQKR